MKAIIQRQSTSGFILPFGAYINNLLKMNFHKGKVLFRESLATVVIFLVFLACQEMIIFWKDVTIKGWNILKATCIFWVFKLRKFKD